MATNFYDAFSTQFLFIRSIVIKNVI